MRLLFCCEYYHPSRGGVQEVMRQIAERMAAAGHEITVVTTRLKERTFTTLNGVRIEIRYRREPRQRPAWGT